MLFFNHTLITAMGNTMNLDREMSGQFNGNGFHTNGQDSLVQPLLTDLYQLTMCYGYWKAKVHEEPACFDLFFRKNPFHGEFTVFAGLEDCLRFVQNFRFSKSDIDYLRSILPTSSEDEFFEYLQSLDCSNIRIHAPPEGSVVFPKVPLITVEGPLAIAQLLETTFLNLVNYASLVATNAARFRQVSGEKIELLEFGLRRAQGPNGGLTASKYCYVGGFDATSNLLAGKLFGIPVKGTQAHSFVTAFSSAQDLKIRQIKHASEDKMVDLFELSRAKVDYLFDNMNWGASKEEVSEGELAAFCAYAIAFPTTFLALIDTYDVLRSGVINFCAVSLALYDVGYRALGVRIDSGDLSYQSKELRNRFRQVSKLSEDLAWFENVKIVASNDIDEDTITSLNEQQHEITSFGVGTHLVTCRKQPALGCVYKLVAVSGQAKIKLSQEVAKISIPGRKKCYRIYSKVGHNIIDLMMLHDEDEPQVDKQILCRHPFEESKRAYAIPAKVERLDLCFWADGELQQKLPTLQEIRKHVKSSINLLRPDHRRMLNPTPYKVNAKRSGLVICTQPASTKSTVCICFPFPVEKREQFVFN